MFCSWTNTVGVWPDFHEVEVGFPEQRALFDLLNALDGTPPPVLDSNELLENPVEMVKAFCDSVGIAFLPNALTWEPSADTNAYSWWDGGSFHQNLRDSTGLKPQRRRYVTLEEAPERVRQVHRRMKPHHDHLFEHRIIV